MIKGSFNKSWYTHRIACDLLLKIMLAKIYIIDRRNIPKKQKIHQKSRRDMEWSWLCWNIYVDRYTKYEFCFLLSLFFILQISTWTCLFYNKKKSVKFVTHIWEVGNSSPWLFRVRQDFFNFGWNFAALKTETKSFADCFLKTVPLGVAEGSQCCAEVQEGNLNQKSLPCPPHPNLVPKHATCWVSNKNNREVHTITQLMEDILSALPQDSPCWKCGAWGITYGAYLVHMVHMKLPELEVDKTWIWSSTSSLGEEGNTPRSMK